MTCWYGCGGAKHYGLKNMYCEPVGPGRRWKWRWQVGGLSEVEVVFYKNITEFIK